MFSRMVNCSIMRVDLGIWDKLSRVVIFLLFVAGALGLVVRHLPLIEKNERLRKKILSLESQIQKEEETARRNRAAIDALCHDPRAVERLVRERWGFAKPGETVIVFEEKKGNISVR
jgi:hypothetical protein